MTIRTYLTPDLPNHRDVAVIMSALRNGAIRKRPTHRLFLPDASLAMAGKILRRLARQKLLSEYTLFTDTQERYYRIGPRCVSLWGHPVSQTRPLGFQALRYAIGSLLYMSEDDTPRKRLFPHELHARLPWMTPAHMNWAYFWEGERLGTVRVELSGRSRNVISKLGRQVYEYSKHQPFRDIIESGHFFIAVICATEQQELAIQEEAQRQDFPVAICTASHDDLIRFMFR